MSEVPLYGYTSFFSDALASARMSHRIISLMRNCPAPYEHRRPQGTSPLRGPRRRQFLKSEVPLYCPDPAFPAVEPPEQ